MRPRDPRRLLASRTSALARVKIVDGPESASPPGGATSSKQSAQITLPRAELERIWDPEHLERLARTYWSYLTRISLGLLRVRYTETSREVVLVGRPLVLLGFSAPEYDLDAGGGSVTWRIERGLLVRPQGRGKGFLRIAARRLPDAAGGDRDATVVVSSEVSNFYPTLRGFGGRVGAAIYSFTQLRVHVIVTHGFLRSLARLELEPSVVGRLRREPGATATPPAATSRSARRR